MPLPLLSSIQLQGFLSFRPTSPAIPLTGLNVLIGPNGSGKSNFVEALSVLRAVPKDLPLPIRAGGGVKDWLWQGDAPATQARIEILFAPGLIKTSAKAIRYRLTFGAQGDSFVVLDERIETEVGEPKPYLFFGYENGRPMLNIRQDGTSTGKPRALQRADIDPTQSILSQRRDPDFYPELTSIADLLGRILIYRTWHFGPAAPMRASCRPDVRTDYLSEELDNLPARLAVLKRDPKVKQRLLGALENLAAGLEDLEIVPEGGTLQLYVTERGRSFPARRLSDGTLRFLCLLAILLDPQPASVIVLEEPELGLHPDMLPIVRDLLVEASDRCQLLVTTHSTQLVDAMTDHSECVLICEKHENGTELSRLTPEEVSRWRKHGTLGTLWMAGHFGGTRW